MLYKKYTLGHSLSQIPDTKVSKTSKTFGISWEIGMRGVFFVIHNKTLSMTLAIMLMSESRKKKAGYPGN